MVLHFGEITDEERFKRLEHKGTEIRKTLMGILLLTKDLCKNELLKSREGEEVIRVLEEAEEAFVNTSLTDRIERLEDVLDVIQRRTKGLYMLIEYLSKYKKSLSN
jgi:hypothetical protein